MPLNNDKALVVFSGGQDSTTCLFWALKNFKEVEALTFSYGQRHSVEIECAKKITERLKIFHKKMDLSQIGLFAKNSLTEAGCEIKNIDPEDGDVGRPDTFVPVRNLVFLSLGASFAVARSAKHLVTGVCQADFSGYPDCREEFVAETERAINLAIVPEIIQIHRPLMNLTKSEIFDLAEDLGCLSEVIEESHTCYLGDREHRHEWGYGCGQCPACVLRRTGFQAYK